MRTGLIAVALALTAASAFIVERQRDARRSEARAASGVGLRPTEWERLAGILGEIDRAHSGIGIKFDGEDRFESLIDSVLANGVLGAKAVRVALSSQDSARANAAAACLYAGLLTSHRAEFDPDQIAPGLIRVVTSESWAAPDAAACLAALGKDALPPLLAAANDGSDLSRVAAFMSPAHADAIRFALRSDLATQPGAQLFLLDCMASVGVTNFPGVVEKLSHSESSSVRRAARSLVDRSE